MSSAALSASETAAVKQRPAKHLPHIPSLDGLRAVSFFAVFLAHAGMTGIPGGFGVTVFFFLSGYLITTLLRLEVEETGTVSFRHFYLRRVLRILPPFYIVVGIATILAGLGVLGGKLWWPPVLGQFLQYYNIWVAYHDWNGVALGTGVLWSLAVEEHFYLVFPALFLVLHRLGIRGRRMALTFLGICALVLLWRTILVFLFHAPNDRTFIMTDTRLDSILFGSVLAVWRNPAIDGVSPSPIWRRVLLPLGLIVLAGTFIVRSDQLRESLRYSLQGLALYPIFVTAIAYPKWGPYRFLNLRFMRHLGVLSYSLYLCHHVIIEAVQLHFPSGALLEGTVSLILALIFSEAMYRLVEKPCAKLRRRFSKVV